MRLKIRIDTMIDLPDGEAADWLRKAASKATVPMSPDAYLCAILAHKENLESYAARVIRERIEAKEG